MIKENNKLEEISLKINENSIISKSDIIGKKVLIYFYPKDDTPGCTKEAIGFNNFFDELLKNGVVVFGISKDSVEKHNKFKAKYGLSFELVSDDGSLCEQFGVWVEKSMYGKKYMGIERSTFYLDETLTVKKIWRKVKVSGHVEEVIEFIKNN